jgi:two-component system chemotaxis response regulator CheV
MTKGTSNIHSMTKTHLNNIMQIMVFQLNDRNFYGINVSKIKSIEDFRRFKIVKNNIKNIEDKKGIFQGYIQYQGEIVPFLNIEKWLNQFEEQNTYKVTIIAEFNRRIISFPIFDIFNICNVSIKNLQTSGINKEVVTYSTLIDINGVEETCLILDVEELLVEVFGIDDNVEQHDGYKLITDKKILIAEDSRSARFIIEEILKDTEISYQLFEDGEKIIKYLDILEDDEIYQIGLIITDLEMPKIDGYQVISYVNKSDKLKHIPVLVNSSMSNQGVNRKTEALGAVGFIAKTDPVKFLNSISEFILKD